MGGPFGALKKFWTRRVSTYAINYMIILVSSNSTWIFLMTEGHSENIVQFLCPSIDMDMPYASGQS